MEVGACQGTNRGGGPCGAKALPGEARCAWHHPAYAARRKAWSAKGGAARSNQARARRQLPAEAMTVAEVQAAVCRAIRRVEAGTMDSGPAQALGSLARTYAALAQLADVEARLGELERAAGIAPRRGG